MKKTSKFLFFGFVAAILSSVAITVTAAVDSDTIKCSVDNSQTCHTVLLENSTISFKGKKSTPEVEEIQ